MLHVHKDRAHAFGVDEVSVGVLPVNKIFQVAPSLVIALKLDAQLLLDGTRNGSHDESPNEVVWRSYRFSERAASIFFIRSS